MAFYKYHVFLCTNERKDDCQSCAQYGAVSARKYLKAACKAQGIHGPGKVRINNAGCLDRCELGPVLVIYPGETWYTYVDEEDLDEILQQHLVAGNKVDRLLV